MRDAVAKNQMKARPGRCAGPNGMAVAGRVTRSDSVRQELIGKISATRHLTYMGLSEYPKFVTELINTA
jgi:hypothetical protein